MRKIYNLIITEKDDIRIINENQTLEDIFDVLDDITYRVGNISASMTNIYQILHNLQKAINNEEYDERSDDIKF